MKYNPKKIEKKWQEKWYKSDVFCAKNSSKSKKFYLLVEFPYPSGDGLHVGHCRSYTALDIVARKRRMEGYNVLFPMGWDAFGLPTENYAIKKGAHPSAVTKKNTDNFRRQMKNLGLSFDWSREINTTDPEYYKWTQWIFVQLFRNGLAYKSKIAINWCPSCKIGLANEEVVLGKCERCRAKVEKKEREQWMIKITEYAERLIKDLDLVDYLEKIKIQQKEWIGRSDGALIKFFIEGGEDFIEVFTTRIDTIFSGTFLILAPEHSFIDKYKNKIQNLDEILEYKNKIKNISDIDRTNKKRIVTGVELKGISVKNPATGETMPVWIADFVLEHYGTGAVFADAHDKRDFELAKKQGIPLRTSIEPADETIAAQVKTLEVCFEGEGILYNSMQFDGLSSAEARPKIIFWLREKNMAQNKTSYKLRDWVFSRQHYWGEPIPMIYCKKCALLRQGSGGQGWFPVQEKDLPVELPKVKKYKPTDTGESPLSLIKKWVIVKCPNCKGLAKRETDTMPNWAGSNWYFLRYTDPKNNKELASKKLLEYWMAPARRSPQGAGGVDWYNGGMEHTTLHLLYSRFIFKFLWDIGVIPKSIGSEPYKKRTSHGMILGEGEIKMSKSKGNVINPDSVVKQYGADTLRIYEMFMGPFDQMIPWDTKGVIGARRFLEKIWNIFSKSQTRAPERIKNVLGVRLSTKIKNFSALVQNSELKKLLHKTIKKVSEDIEAMKFNTAVSSMMEFINAWNVSKTDLDKKDLENFLKILSPFAPHLAEELWSASGFKGLCCNQKWPEYNLKLIKEEKILFIVQINGKVRDKILVDAGLLQKEAEKLVLKSKKIKDRIADIKEIKKVIFVADKLINLVTIDKKK
ncbi:MAG: leucyl-tRNA ligase LeuS [Parcubacteria group bacterium Licking1014_1]|nr:MAG: leucyl-tRNA ligase LeuS [Parcubacteria group bacterium Licking1014_1]